MPLIVQQPFVGDTSPCNLKYHCSCVMVVNEKFHVIVTCINTHVMIPYHSSNSASFCSGSLLYRWEFFFYIYDLSFSNYLRNIVAIFFFKYI